MKKLLAMCLSVLVLLAAFPVAGVLAGTNDPAFVASAAEGEPGDTVQVTVSTQNNPGITSLKLQVGYDANALKLTTFTPGTDFTGVSFGQVTSNPTFINWVDMISGANNTANAVIATLTFEIKDTAPDGEYAITMTYDPDDVYNFDWDNVTFDVVAGSVKVTCKHTNKTTVPAEPSTCKKQGNAEYKICDKCGAVVEGSDAKLPLADHTYTNSCDTICNVCDAERPITHTWEGDYTTDANNHWVKCSVCGEKKDETEGAHTGGTATCKDKAVCDVCDAAYGEYAAHVLTNHAASPADHSKGGNIEYWTCDVCNKFFKDAAGTQEITEAQTKTDKVPHDYDDAWSKDDNQHWHDCSCGDKSGLANHTFDNACDTTCDVCGYTRVTEHQWESKYTTDTDNHWVKCAECGAKKNEGAHTGGTATCKDHKVCETCGASYGMLAAHDYSVEKAEATYLKSEATCTKKAVYAKSCSVCGIASPTATFESGEVNPANHVGTQGTKDAKEPTCKEEGYTGNIHCNDCGAKTADGQPIPKLPHTIKEWTVSKEPTSTEEGEKSGVCTACNDTFTVTIGKLAAEIKEDKIETTLESTEIEIVGETNITEDVIFVADEVKDDLEDAETEKVEEAVATLDEVKEHKLAAVFDLKLILRETATNGDVIDESEFELKGTVKVTIPVPAAVLEVFENLKLVHVKDDGTAELVPFTMKDGKATFEATGFSYYTFVGTEKAAVTPPAGDGGNEDDGEINLGDDDKKDPEDGNGSDKSPLGGDSNVTLWIVLALISALSLAAAFALKAKRVR